jgi:hypothetical protein
MTLIGGFAAPDAERTQCRCAQRLQVTTPSSGCGESGRIARKSSNLRPGRGNIEKPPASRQVPPAHRSRNDIGGTEMFGRRQQVGEVYPEGQVEAQPLRRRPHFPHAQHGLGPVRRSSRTTGSACRGAGPDSPPAARESQKLWVEVAPARYRRATNGVPLPPAGRARTLLSPWFCCS